MIFQHYLSQIIDAVYIKEFENFIKMLGIKHIRTAAYHQSSNGQAERYVLTVKKCL